MHVAFFGDHHPATLGGQQVSLLLQRRYLERAGHRVTLCTPAARHVSPAPPGPDEVLLPALPAGGYSFTLAGAVTDRAADRGFAGRPPVDVVHVQADFWGAWAGYRFARRHGVPVVHTLHTNIGTGLPAVMPFPRAVLRLVYAEQRRHLRVGPVRDLGGYLRAFAAVAAAVVVPSSHFADHVAGHGVVPRPHVVPTGVDDDVVGALRARPAPRRARPLLLWPGRVSREKHLDDVLHAFAGAGLDADLLVAGDGADLPRCRGVAARLGLGDRVRFAGALPHADTLAAIRDADLVVQSSVGYETQGLTVYEAVSLGTPVLLRDPAVARDIPAGWSVRTADDGVPALAAALRSAASAPRPAGPPPDDFVQSRLTGRLLAVYRGVRAPRGDHGRGTPAAS